MHLNIKTPEEVLEVLRVYLLLPEKILEEFLVGIITQLGLKETQVREDLVDMEQIIKLYHMLHLYLTI